MTELLRATNLKKSYPKMSKIALDVPNFSLAEGEILGVLGKSGSGKSTFLQVLAGLLVPDTGEIYLEDKLLTKAAYLLVKGYAEIQLVPQDFKLLPNHTLSENILYPIRQEEDSYQEQRLNTLLSLCQLEGLERRYPRELSGGQQQRVAIARVLASQPPVLLLDEPFSQLDVCLRQSLTETLRYIRQEEQVSIVLVGHEARELLRLSDRLAFMEAGQFLQIGTTSALYNSPQSLNLGKFLGEINVFSLSEASKIWKNLPKSTQSFGLRPEYVKVIEKAREPYNFEAKIRQEYYEGNRSLYEVESTEQIHLKFYDSSQKYTKGQALKFWLPQESLIVFDHQET